MTDTLQQLVDVSRELGREDRHLTILGEGNTSADLGDGTFYVKASGHQLGAIGDEGFSRARLDDVMALLDGEQPSEEALHEALMTSLVAGSTAKPSIETMMHAVCLREGGAKFVGHTHAESCNMILCSMHGAEPFLSHIFPDGVVVCGAAPAVVPYCDPGFDLAASVRRSIANHREKHGKPPKLILLINHGIVALGQTATEVLNITLMAEKWARILFGTLCIGGPRVLPAGEVARIDNRLDEIYRRK
ncbi:MAG: aldolase [Phycisphaera sp.]|nr:aldolase [Phycisphaera sp.]